MRNTDDDLAMATSKSPDDTDSDFSDGDSDDMDLSKPWLVEFWRYLNTHNVFSDSSMTVVKWWGVSIFFTLMCT